MHISHITEVARLAEERRKLLDLLPFFRGKPDDGPYAYVASLHFNYHGRIGEDLSQISRLSGLDREDIGRTVTAAVRALLERRLGEIQDKLVGFGVLLENPA